MIRYVEGDATDHPTPKIVIAHVCNNVGGWGAGFVLALSKRWPEPEAAYRRWAYERTHNGKPFELGQVQYVQVKPTIFVANMIAQEGVRFVDGVPPIRYEAVEECLSSLARACARTSTSVHMPRIGCGLAGGDWQTIEAIIDRTLVASGVPVTVYDLPQ